MGQCKQSKSNKKTMEKLDESENEAAKRAPVKRDSLDAVSVNAASFVRKNTESITDIYRFGNVIGAGHSKVVIGTHRKLGTQRAIKSISNKQYASNSKHHENFVNEVDALKKMDHPNILKIYEFYEDDEAFHLVTEICSGGDLKSLIASKRTVGEKLAASIMQQLIGALHYCHQQDIVHRNIRPDNILLETRPTRNSEDVRLKIVNFGQVTLTGKSVKTFVDQTHYYTAPELFTGNHNETCDIWSSGVILYQLLCGYPPFNGQTDQEIEDEVKEGAYEFPPREWDKISDNAKDLIESMLIKDHRERFTTSEVLDHPWLSNNVFRPSMDTAMALNTLENLKNFRSDKKFEQAVVSFITSQMLNQEDIKALADTFKAFDTNGDGKLSTEELIEGYSKLMGQEAAIAEVDKIMTQVDVDGNGYIEYTEFLAASMNQKKLLSTGNLDKAFAAFDKDGSGTVSSDEIRNMLGLLSVEAHVWDEIIQEVDQNGDGEIDLEEFKKMMIKLV